MELLEGRKHEGELERVPQAVLQEIVCSYAVKAGSLRSAVPRVDPAPPWAAPWAVLSSLLSCQSLHTGQTSISRLFMCKGITPFLQNSYFFLPGMGRNRFRHGA